VFNLGGNQGLFQRFVSLSFLAERMNQRATSANV
jgi:hypothetical protein